MNINATPATHRIEPTPLPEPPPLIPFLPRPHTQDPRRAKFTIRDKRFPMAGLMREDGGVFAFMDSVRAARKDRF